MSKNNISKKTELIFKFIAAVGFLTILPGCLDKNNSVSNKSTATVKKAKPNKKTAVPKEIKKGAIQVESGEATFEEMVAQVEFDIQKGHHLSAVQWLDKIIRRYPEHNQIPEFKYKRAECCLLGKKYLLASEAYDNFAKIYPSDPRSKDARFLALSSLYNYTKCFATDSDSTNTKNVIENCANMLKDPSMEDKHKQVVSIMKHCEERILNKEIAIFDSYVRRKKFDSASQRLEKIKTEYLAKNKHLEPRVVYLECKLATATQNEDKAKNCLEILEEQYSDSKYTKMASGYVNAGAFANVIYG